MGGGARPGLVCQEGGAGQAQRPGLASWNVPVWELWEPAFRLPLQTPCWGLVWGLPCRTDCSCPGQMEPGGTGAVAAPGAWGRPAELKPAL